MGNLAGEISPKKKSNWGKSKWGPLDAVRCIELEAPEGQDTDPSDTITGDQVTPLPVTPPGVTVQSYTEPTRCQEKIRSVKPKGNPNSIRREGKLCAPKDPQTFHSDTTNVWSTYTSLIFTRLGVY
jgi:hypothetical protein